MDDDIRPFRIEATDTELDDLRRSTSVLPFAAVLLGRTKIELSELPWPMIAIAVVAWVLVAFFHGDLFGAPLLTLLG